MSTFDVILMCLTVFSAGLVVYHHVGHPIAQKLISLMIAPPALPDFDAVAAKPDLPRISLMMPAFNEADHMLPKLENLMGLIYPADLLDITIVCDGCTDDTAQIVRDFLEKAGAAFPFRLDLIDHADNAGKLQRLNETIGGLRGDVVALSDVSAIVSLDCMLRLAAWFSDPQVGAVSGQYRLLQPGGVGQQAYWDYQVMIKRLENKMGSVLGAHGAFYGFRKSAFRPLDPGTINDDFILPMRIIEQGMLVRYDDGIVALEKEVMGEGDEQARRLRIAKGNVQQAVMLRSLCLPKFGWVAYNFAFGKVLRSLCPVLLTLVLICSGILSINYELLFICLCIQIAIYFAAFCDMIATRWLATRDQYYLGPITYLIGGHWIGARAILWRIFSRSSGLRWR